MPLNAIQVFPINTLYSIDDQVLVSFQYLYKEIDCFVFNDGKSETKVSIREKFDWGISKNDASGNYLRFKSKKLDNITMIIESNK